MVFFHEAQLGPAAAQREAAEAAAAGAGRRCAPKLGLSGDSPNALGGSDCHGFPCKAGTEVDEFERSGTLARDNGALAQLVLADAHEIDGRSYPRGTRLRLTREGRVQQAKSMNIDVMLFKLRS